jgi:hypothetical protein
MDKKSTSWITLFIASAVCGTAQGHHSYAQFDRCQSISIEGEIENLLWANPHVVVTLKQAEASTYRVEWWDLQRLVRDGIATESLNVGDRVVVTGSMHRDPELHVMTLITEIRRPKDNWSWVRPSPVSRPEACSAQ